MFGDEAVDSAGWLFLPDTAWPTTIRTDDRASVTGEGVTVSGVIVNVDRLSMRVAVRVESQPIAA